MGETKNRRGTVTPENLEEAARLKRLWLDAQPALRKQGLGSQEAFGAHFGIGNQAAVGFFLNGHTALSDEQRQHNTDNGMIALAEQLDRIEQAQQALQQRLQNVEAILRGLR